MSINSGISRSKVRGNGGTIYGVPFVFFTVEEVKVVLTHDTTGEERTLEIGTDYNVTGAGNPEGGALELGEALSVDWWLVVYREVEATQLTEYVEGAEFPARSHERALDKLTMLVQQLERKLGLAFKLRESDGEIDPVTKKDNAIFGINAEGNAVFRDAAQVKAWLSLAAPVLNFPTKFWQDDAERALAVPDFYGQVGVQIDENTIWVSSGLFAGDWVAPSPGIVDGSITTQKLAVGALANSTLGHARMADGFLSADAEGRAKMADSYLTLAKIAAGIFTADATGRGKFANGFVTSDLMATGAAVGNMLPGAVIQSKWATTNARTVYPAKHIPFDTSIPQIDEGETLFSVKITPTSATSKIRLTAHLTFTSAGGTYQIAAIFRVGQADALNANMASVYDDLDLMFEDSPGTTSEVEYRLNIGTNSGDLQLNQKYGFNRFGASVFSSFKVEEVKA